ncbi:MAG TPA: FG-GAP-like repeat-containing protein [Bryobacteraceae bacterium]
MRDGFFYCADTRFDAKIGLLNRLFLAVLLCLLGCAACSHSQLPKPGSKQYADLSSAFYLGLAGLQTGEDVRARKALTRATQIAPSEPAPWADLGILDIREQQLEAAFKNVNKARSLAPSNSRIEALLGLIESKRGNLSQAEAHLKKAVSLDRKNVKAIYSLAQELERDGGAANQAAAQKLLQQILHRQPSNTAVLLDALRLAAKRGNSAEARTALMKLQPFSAKWPDAGSKQFATLQRALAGGNLRAVALQAQFLRNVLLRVPAYRANLDRIRTPATLVAQPFVRFLRLPSPNSQPAPPDMAMTFQSQPISDVHAAKVPWLGAIFLDDKSPATVAWSDTKALHLASGATLPLPGRQPAPLARHSVAPADLNYDFKTDVTIATASGFRIYRQKDSQHFQDVTSAARIPSSVANASYTGVWAFDVDLDGDLDLILGVAHGDPVVLRNNGDGTFTQIHPFDGLDGVTAFAAADIDGDGTPDVAFIDGNGNLRVFLNRRLGDYQPITVPASVASGIEAIAAADIDGNGTLDFVLLKKDSSVVRLSMKPDTTDWESAVLFHASGHLSPDFFIADLDNNGALDIVANGQVFLGNGKAFAALPASLPAAPRVISDRNAGGRLDVLALTSAGSPVALMNHGTKHYHWEEIHTRAAHATGDQRINSFGIGGEIEIRAGLLAQEQIIDAPVLHFGLGDHTSVQFARIVWPNGFVQAEFDLKPDQTVLAVQRMKGSCPMLFTWNGRRMQFLKDVGPWGAALGLNVNAQGKGIYRTREWFKIPGSRLVPHEDLYDLRITSEYWETYYMDYYSLLAIDHPTNSAIYVDERFSLPPPKLGIIVMTRTKPFAHAIDNHGTDVSNIVRNLDGRYLDTFGRGQYQGITHDHWVQLDLPPEAPKTGPLYLVAQGWIHDTDTTIVRALAQNSRVHPHTLSVEVPDAQGRWITVRRNLGFPDGRMKGIVLNIGGIFRPGAPRELRLRTNMEIYWDRISWGAGLPKTEPIQTHHIALSSARLRYRGFSLITKANLSSPETPHYYVLKDSALRWHDQTGYATRYGAVRKLLEKVDSRYVIMAPGDELRMQFAALPLPAAGYKRDFVLISDGWVKDADYNTRFSKTILPLPYHGMESYLKPPTTLEADHAYQLHPNDWRTYQTRYVTADHFRSALWNTQ